MYKKVLIPMDGSDVAECVLQEVGKILGQGAEVFLLRVVEEVGNLASDAAFDVGVPAEVLDEFGKKNQSEAMRYLSKVAAELKEKGVVAHIVVTSGKAAEAIVEQADRRKVDLIAISTHGRSGVSRWALGSVADKVLRTARVPVLLVTPSGCRIQG